MKGLLREGLQNTPHLGRSQSFRLLRNKNGAGSTRPVGCESSAARAKGGGRRAQAIGSYRHLRIHRGLVQPASSALRPRVRVSDQLREGSQLLN